MKLPGVYDCFLEKWKDYQTVWVISDTHFNDVELRKGLNNELVHRLRPSDEEMVKAINSKVGKKDVLIHLGDVGSWEYFDKLKGYKVLIAGNHEVGSTECRKHVDEFYEGPLMLGEKLILSHEPLNVPWAYNLHGHRHDAQDSDINHSLNVCVDVYGATPLNLNHFLKGGLSHIKPLHRTIIDNATERRRKKEKRYD